MRKWLVNLLFTFIIFLVMWVFGEEESLFNLSEFNVAHIYLFCLSIFSIYFDIRSKFKSGMWVYNDVSVYVYALSYSLNLIFYFFIIWFGFFLHVLVPSNNYLVDEMFFAVSLSLNICSLLISYLYLLIIFFFIIIFIIYFNFSLLTIFWTYCITVGIGYFLILFTTDVTCSKANTNSKFANKNFQSDLVNFKNTTSYDDYYVKGGFDWHSAFNKNPTIRFYDYSSFLFLLLFFIFIVIFLLLLILVLIELQGDSCNNKQVFNKNIFWFLKSYIYYMLLVLFFIVVFVSFNYLYVYFLSLKII